MSGGHSSPPRPLDADVSGRHSDYRHAFLVSSRRRATRARFAIVRARVVRTTVRATCAIGTEVGKIYRGQNHGRLIKETLLAHGAGLLMGLSSAKLIGRFFDVKGMHNLWGLFSKRTLVSENTYQVLCFAAEFIVALVVFTLTDHYVREYRARRAEREAP